MSVPTTHKRPTCLIAGVSGQDGFYLSEQLADRYTVYGVDRRVGADVEQFLADGYETDLRKPTGLLDILEKIRPDEFYYLAGHNFSSESSENIDGDIADFLSINLGTPAAALELITRDRLPCRAFYASSAHIFGDTKHYPQDEATPHNPNSYYGISKSACTRLCAYFRERGAFVVSGILFNHESPRRSEKFVTGRIARAAARASLGQGKELRLRNADAVVDWGAAPDYVGAMWLTLQQPTADAYIISSGQAHSVREFAEVAFASVGLAASDWMVDDAEPVVSRPTPYLGNNAHLIERTGWQPRMSFTQLVTWMVQAALAEARQATLTSAS